MIKLKENISTTILSVFLIVIGLWFVIADAAHIKNIIFIIIGISLIISSSHKLYYTKQTNQNIIMPIITIAIGVILIVFSSIIDWFLVLIGLYILVEPIITIFASTNKKEQLKFEAPKIIAGTILILLWFDVMYKVLFIIVGGISIIIGLYLIYAILTSKVVTVSSKTRKDIIDVEE